MRNRYANNPFIWGLMIVLTLGGWHRATAMQTTPAVGIQDPATQVQEEPAPAPATPVEALPLPEDQSTTVFVEDRFCGWQGAALAGEVGPLSTQLRANWVMVDDSGLLRGTVLGINPSPQSVLDTNASSDRVGVGPTLVNPARSGGLNSPTRWGMNVYLVYRGRVLGTARLNSASQFEFQGVKPGTYALVGYGPSGFFAFGLNVLPHAANANQPRELYIPAQELSGTPVTDWVTRNAPNVHFRTLGKQRFGEAIDDPPRLYGIVGLRTFSPPAIPATSIVSHQIATSRHGRLVGRLHFINSFDGRPTDLRTTLVQLVKDGTVAHQIGTDNFGVFAFEDVAPGRYALRAAGPDGLGAIQIEVVESSESDGLPIDLALISPETIGWLNHLMQESAYFAAISGPRPDATSDQCGQRRPQCGGCACGCSDHPCQCGQGSGWGAENEYGVGQFGSGESYRDGQDISWGAGHGGW